MDLLLSAWNSGDAFIELDPGKLQIFTTRAPKHKGRKLIRRTNCSEGFSASLDLCGELIYGLDQATRQSDCWSHFPFHSSLFVLSRVLECLRLRSRRRDQVQFVGHYAAIV